MKNAYWKNSYIYKGRADAEKVSDELQKIEVIIPQNIVERAADPILEMHKCFEWEDSEAAYLHRLHEARLLSNHLVVTCTGKTEEGEKFEIMMPAFPSVKVAMEDDEGNAKDVRQYVAITEAHKDIDYQACIMEEVKQSLSQVATKMNNYESFFKAKHIRIIERVLEGMLV